MPFIPRHVLRGRHYAVYTEAKEKVKTKAALLKEALGIAAKEEEHIEWIDFIPARFTLQCFDEKTEILTDKGWKFFKDLKQEDKVAQITRVEGHKLEFVKPEKIWCQFYRGELLGIKNDYIDILTNPQHKHFVKKGEIGRTWEKRKASQCYGKKIRLSPGLLEWGGFYSGNKDWFELLGFFFGDGSYQVKGERGSRNYCINFTQKNKKGYLEDLLRRNKLDFKKFPRKPEGCYSYKVEGIGFANYFSRFGKKEEKLIPPDIRNASPDLLKAFLIGYSFADGYKREGKDWRLGGSKRLIDQLQEIALKAGYTARVRTESGKNSFARSTRWILSISQAKFRYVTVLPHHWYKIDYEGKIWSVKVPSGIILVRRNGKPLITGNCHGWFDEDSKTGYTNLKQIQDTIRKALKEGRDPIKDLKGKWHYDLRIQKATAPTWFGLTPFRAPWTGTPDNKVMGTVKGYQSIAPGGKKLQKFLMERAEREMAKEGIAERRDRIEWMKVKAQWFPIDSPGNPQKNQPAAMVAIEYYKPAVLHRRGLDFIDCTFLGDYLKGRYYNRLVERKLKPEELMEWQKEAIRKGQAKAFYQLNFYFWKAKDQFDLKEMLQIALGKKTKERIPAPPSKK